jgi:protein SCO1/2
MPRPPAIPQGEIASRFGLAGRVEPKQQLGARLPLDTTLTDWQHRLVRLGDYFTDRPVIFVLGYYRCPNLCGTVMHGVLEALSATGLSAREWRIVYVSVDASETAELAASQRALWLDYFRYLNDIRDPVDVAAMPRAEMPELDLLVGTPSATAAITQAAGFAFEPDPEAMQASEGSPRFLSRFSHAAEFMVATPQGQLSRYEFGVRYDPRNLRLALVAASQGHIGDLADRLVLLCSHFDPATGRYNGAVMNVLRTIGLASVLALTVFAWRHRHTGLTHGPGTSP